jgi:hypothetical protein
MKITGAAAWGRATSRRSFVKQLAGGLVAAAARGIFARVPGASSLAQSGAVAQSGRVAPSPRLSAVVSFHLDQPYLDESGRGLPYRPPRGLRSGQGLAELSELEFRTLMPYSSLVAVSDHA